MTWSALIEKWCRHDYFVRRPKAGRVSSKSVPLLRSGPCGSVGWCSKGCTRTPTLAGWCSCCCANGVVFQKLGWCSKKLSQNPCGSMGWCSKSWGGALKSCPRIPTARWGWCSKSWGGVPKSCPRIPTVYTTKCILYLYKKELFEALLLKNIKVILRVTEIGQSLK